MMGKPVYRQWAEVPATLATKTQLGPEGTPMDYDWPKISP